MELCTKNVSISFHDGHTQRTILKNVNICFNEKNTNILMGPSGSGKSSLLYVLSSMRKPTQGSVFLDGAEISNRKNAEKVRFNSFGFVFQSPYLIPHMTVLENICVGRAKHDLTPKACELLEKMSIASLRDKMPHELSGGERQRVSIARALVNNPSVIVCDEPTASLDHISACAVINLLRSYSYGKILIIATHDMSLLSNDDRVLKIDNMNVIG